MAAPINPSDIFFIKSGSYSGVKSVPCIAGFEGSGVVIENGGGLIGWGLVNKKVAFTPIANSGTYAQYAIAKSSECFPVDDSMSFEHASMSFVNPLTALAMLDLSKARGVKAVIVDAAASALGRMLNRFLPL
jgi:NADPH:quinone reductase-like Zn-dependent oxidoreductase